MQGDKIVNIFDCAKIFFDPTSIKASKHNKFLPLHMDGKTLKVGDRVMAIGYPGVMNVEHIEETNTISFQESLHGAIGTITYIYPSGRGNSRP